MLLSLLLILTPTAPTRLNGFYGREVQAWFLEEVRRHDSQQAEALHKGNQQKPYTLSNLILPRAGRQDEEEGVPLIPGNICLLRITSLSTGLSDLLLSKVAVELPGKRLRLKWSEFKILRLSRENAWDGQASFEDLVKNAEQGAGASATLQFASPTAFRSGSIDLSLPTPDQVWRSLWWRWNYFSPQELHLEPLWPKFAAQCLVVSDFQLRSSKVSFKNGEKGAATGCMGQATYRLLAEKHCGEFAPMRRGAERTLHILADFALFSGVGHHTTTGLGQARKLPVSSSPQADYYWPYIAAYPSF